MRWRLIFPVTVVNIGATEFRVQEFCILVTEYINVFYMPLSHSKGNKTVPGKVATTRTEDGHKQTTKTSTTI